MPLFDRLIGPRRCWHCGAPQHVFVEKVGQKSDPTKYAKRADGEDLISNHCVWYGCRAGMVGTDGYCGEHAAFLAERDRELEDRLGVLA